MVFKPMFLACLSALLALPLCSLSGGGQDAKEAPDPEIAKARAATGKTLLKCANAAKEGWELLPSGLFKLKRGGQLRLALSGEDYGEILIKHDNIIVEGDPEGGDPSGTSVSFIVNADGCVIRNLHCRKLVLKGDLTLIDCCVDEIECIQDEGGVRRDGIDNTDLHLGGKAKFSLLVGNCGIGSCVFRGKKDYVILGVDKDGRPTKETVKVKGSSLFANFINCAFKGATPSFVGNMDLKFKRCVFYKWGFFDKGAMLSESGAKEHKDSLGKVNIALEDNALLPAVPLPGPLQPTAADKDANERIQSLRKCFNGKISNKGRLAALHEDPFLFDERGFSTENKELGRNIGQEGPAAANKGPDPNFKRANAFALKEDSIPASLGFGASFGPDGFPGASALRAPSK